MSLVLSTKPTTFQAHWKTDSHLSLRYPNHRNSNHIRSFSSFSGLIGFKKKFSLKKGGCLIESYRHGIHVGKSLECGGRVNFDIPAENREDACQSVQAQKMACSGLEFLAVSFYHFVRIEDPQEEVAKHQEFLESRNIMGRIYINQQGINAQYSGPVLDALAYAEWVKEDARFKHILVQMSPSSTHAFPRLKLRYKSSLIQVEGGVSDLPILDSSMRALPLTPREWKIRLSIINCSETESDEIATKENTSLNQGRKSLLLDVRNGYEWDIGHFQGAKRPDVDCFRSTTFGISDLKTNISDPLARIDKENTDILMYCTGGIRCDVYSAILRHQMTTPKAGGSTSRQALIKEDQRSDKSETKIVSKWSNIGDTNLGNFNVKKFQEVPYIGKPSLVARRIIESGIIKAAGFPPAVKCHELMIECARHYDSQSRTIVTKDGNILAYLSEEALDPQP
ncbi:uncharacterized protein LOC131031479 isoform X3 [Cryptomeria japonica]|uniref:uncharacterized protein LOC131031479 isoform X3 n=1 Tax=Cryptomeria japonica TaxID=3369 RepID=UPI0025ACC54E|nr:uncharacterized protein LOC131031479 isoform X3 [Cryptomeria japonica]